MFHKELAIAQYRLDFSKPSPNSLFQELLSQGAYGKKRPTRYWATTKHSSDIYAIKLLNYDDENEFNRLLLLLITLQDLAHPYTLPVHSIGFDLYSFKPPTQLFYIAQYAPKTLYDSLYTDGKVFKIEEIIELVFNLADLLVHIKTKARQYHGNIKSNNIYLSGSQYVLGDWGSSPELLMASDCDDESVELLLENPYLAPDLKCKGLGPLSNKQPFANDVYSLGIVILELTGCDVNALRGVSSNSDVYREIMELNLYGSVTSFTNQDFHQLLRQMVCVDPDMRPPIERVHEKLGDLRTRLNIFTGVSNTVNLFSNPVNENSCMMSLLPGDRESAIEHKIIRGIAQFNNGDYALALSEFYQALKGIESLDNPPKIMRATVCQWFSKVLMLQGKKLGYEGITDKSLEFDENSAVVMASVLSKFPIDHWKLEKLKNFSSVITGKESSFETALLLDKSLEIVSKDDAKEFEIIVTSECLETAQMTPKDRIYLKSSNESCFELL